MGAGVTWRLAAPPDGDTFESIWRLTEGWSHAWDRWKTNSFQELRIEEMSETMAQYRTEVNRLGKCVAPCT